MQWSVFCRRCISPPTSQYFINYFLHCRFTVAVVIDKVQYESAIGKTKKQAKAQAAVLAWNTIEQEKKVSGGVPTD